MEWHFVVGGRLLLCARSALAHLTALVEEDDDLLKEVSELRINLFALRSERVSFTHPRRVTDRAGAFKRIKKAPAVVLISRRRNSFVLLKQISFRRDSYTKLLQLPVAGE